MFTELSLKRRAKPIQHALKKGASPIRIVVPSAFKTSFHIQYILHYYARVVIIALKWENFCFWNIIMYHFLVRVECCPFILTHDYIFNIKNFRLFTPFLFNIEVCKCILKNRLLSKLFWYGIKRALLIYTKVAWKFRAILDIRR